jgi:hypothetical protein
MSWAGNRSAWSERWASVQRTGLANYASSIRKAPETYRQKVTSFLALLADVRTRLDRMRKLPLSPGEEQRLNQLETRWVTLAAGVYGDTQPSTSIGVAPIAVGIIVAGVVVGVAGIAWSVAAYEYAVNLREHTALLENELNARVEASRAGRTLQPSGVPPVPTPAGEARKLGTVLLGGLVLVAGAVAIPAVWKWSR